MAAAAAPRSVGPFLQSWSPAPRMEDHDKTGTDAKPEYKYPGPIIGKMCGSTEIVIAEQISRPGKFRNAPCFYRGKVKCGKDQLVFMKATILAFQMHESDKVVTLHHCLSLFKHPYVMNSLGYGYGSGEQEGYIFLAFPYFEYTLADFMRKDSNRSMDLERFTEEFVGLIRNVVYALLELHKYRYYCPNLSKKQIIIVNGQNSLSAKLWDFCALELGNEKGKDMDWVRLGHILRNTAETHKSYTPEIADLCKHMIQGTLKGIDILKHSAMLSVRVKFDNILALNTFALTYCKKQSSMWHNSPPLKANLQCKASDLDNIAAMDQLFCDSSDKDKTIAALKILLDSDVSWKEEVPLWIKERMKTLKFTLPKLDTYREFLWEIRCLIEHENSYVPPEAHKKISSWVFEYSDIQPDLEYEIRQSWPYLFLVAQKFSTSLQLKNS